MKITFIIMYLLTLVFAVRAQTTNVLHLFCKERLHPMHTLQLTLNDISTEVTADVLDVNKLLRTYKAAGIALEKIEMSASSANDQISILIFSKENITGKLSIINFDISPNSKNLIWLRDDLLITKSLNNIWSMKK